MKNIIIILITYLHFTTFVNAQEFEKNNSENATEFVKRNIPSIENRVLELTETALETKLWDNKTSLIICFYLNYNDDIKSSDKYLMGYVYYEIKPNIYKRVLIDSDLDVSVNKIKIESIFFTNCDNDKNKELAILYSQECGEGDLIDCEGKIYFTNFYDDFKFGNQPNKLIEITKFKEIFNELEGKFDDGNFNNAKYKTASSVKKELKKLGY